MRTCPHCKLQHHAAASINKEDYVAPQPGDLGLCVDCGEWMIIGQNYRARKPTDEEYIEIGSNPDCQRARWAWTKIKGSSQG